MWLALLTSVLAASSLIFIFVTLVALLLIRYYHLQRVKANHIAPAILVISQSPANHSPRVAAHVHALLHFFPEYAVVLLAEPPNPISEERLAFFPLPQYPPLAQRNVFTLFKKAASLFIAQASCLSTISCLPLGVRHIILATPPALPLLPLLILSRPFIFPRSQITVDVHNLAFTLSAQHKPNPYFLFLAKELELRFLRRAHTLWTVSKALSDFLFHIGNGATVLRDLPSDSFTKLRRQPLSEHEKKELITRVQDQATEFGASLLDEDVPMLVSSTSWTPDEDLSMLRTAIQKLDEEGLRLRVVITGKGPLRSSFERGLEHINLQNVQLWLAWLPFTDYAALLSTATLGVSLHASSSALDLPMKAVDMLGAGLPVLGLRYACIDELVKDGTNGLLFDNSEELSCCIRRVLKDDQELQILRKGAAESFEEEWLPYWETTALPTLRRQHSWQHYAG